MSPKVLVAGIGNIFLGDDGFGTETARRLGELDLPDGVQVADYGVSGMHLAYDLAGGYDATILLDATQRGEGEPGTLYLIELDADEIAHDTTVDEPLGDGRFVDAHGMHPESVLSLLKMLGGEAGQVMLVGCEPADLYPGIGLSSVVEAAIPKAVDMVVDLLGEILPSLDGSRTKEPTVPTTTGE
jgi:hydrogenase maturation protease